MSSISMSLYIADGATTYGELRKFVEATSFYDDETPVGIEQNDNLEVIGFKDHI